MRRNENFISCCGGGRKQSSPLGKQCGRSLKCYPQSDCRTQPFYPQISLQEQGKRIFTQKSVHECSLFTTAQQWKQCKCPEAHRWRSKSQSISTVGYYSAIKRSKVQILEQGRTIKMLGQAKKLPGISLGKCVCVCVCVPMCVCVCIHRDQL